MKKLLKYLLVILIIFFTSIINANASVETYTRTTTDLRVREDIKVTSSNREAILKTPSVDETDKIYDFANLIEIKDEVEIFNNINDFIKSYNIDMVVVTIDYNDKYSSLAYADDFFDYNNFGKNKSRDGIILLIDMYNREIAISTSGNAILLYDDERIDNMLDVIYPYIKNKTYKTSVDKFIAKASNFASLGIPNSNQDYIIDEDGNYVKVGPFPWTIIIVLSMVITVVAIALMISKHKTIKKATKADLYLDKESVNIINRQDDFITTFTNATRIATSSSSGGSRGGSTIRRSSSGRSHGGGSRRF